jgi:hypothetical protein
VAYCKIVGIDINIDYSRVLNNLFWLLEKYILFISFTFIFLKNLFVLVRFNILKADLLSFELAVQILLAMSFFCIVFPVSYSALLSNVGFGQESDGGLSNLKTLLYEQTGLFLLLSTVVLLVALIGAAVMTRNKK